MRKIFLLLSFLSPYFAMSGGFQIDAQGQISLSMGGAHTAIGNDATTVFYNPGAMSFAEKSSVTIGGTFIKTNTNYLSPYNGNVEAENPALIPFHAYLNYVLNEQISLGVAINNPFSSNFKWADNWEGRYVTQEMKFNATCIQPTFSYKFNENFGIGVGVVFGFGNMNYNKAVPVEGQSPFASEKLKISGNGMGLNLGVFYKFNEDGTLGINFRSAMKFDMQNGDAAFTNIPPSFSDSIPASAKFNTVIKCPNVISAAVAYHFTQALIATLQLDYTTWSSFDSLNFIFPDYPNQNILTGRHSKNSICGRVGGQYNFTDEFNVRVGAAYDLASVPQDHLSPDLPESDKILLTAGMGYKFNKSFSGDVTIGMENYFERKGTFTDANMTGSYKSNSVIGGIGLNYEF